MNQRNVTVLKKGERAIVHEILQGESALRLMEMGIVPGVELELLAISPFGDPIAIQLDDFSLSLRLNDARLIIVK
jgi:ferrous iron transport protein A